VLRFRALIPRSYSALLFYVTPCSYELLLPKRTSLRHRVPADDGFLDFLSYLLTPDPTTHTTASPECLDL
jgi:hypothetical protein